MSTHSCVIAPQLKDSLSMAEGGKYGKMFASLPDGPSLVSSSRTTSPLIAACSCTTLG